MSTGERARRLVICLFAALLVGVPALGAPTPAAAEAPWSDLGAPMALGRQSFGATTGPCPGTPLASPRRCVYAIGGASNFSAAPPAGLPGEVFNLDNPGAGWQPLPPMTASPTGRPQSAAATGSDGKIYAFGQNLYDWSSVERFNPQTQAWELVPPLPVPRYQIEAVADDAGRIYALGGYSGAGATADVAMFDPLDEAAGWVLKASMSKPRSNFGAAFSRGRIYAVGGTTGDSDGAEVYDPESDSWRPIAPLPEGRQQLTAVSDEWGQIWAIGGYLFGDSDVPVIQRTKNSAFAYDPVTNQWQAGPLLNVRRENAAAVASADNRLFVIGGDNATSSSALTSTETLLPPDLDFESWVEPPSIPYDWVPGRPMGWPRAYLAATTAPCPEPAVASCIYAIGGSTQSSNTATDTSEAFNLVSRAWAPVPRMALSRRSHAAATDPQGRIYAIGGVGANYAYLSTVERFDPADPGAGWTMMAPMNLPRASLAAVTGSNGKIYAIGGQAGAGHQTMEVYDPASDSWTLLTSTMSVARSGLVAAASGDFIYAIGGPSPYNTVEVFSIASGTWTAGVPLSSPRQAPAAAVGTDGRIYVIGSGPSGAERSVEVFDPREPEPVWRQAAPTDVPRYAAAAATAPAPDGRIFLLGGYSNTGNLNSTEIYTPGPARDIVPPTGPGPIVTGPYVERRIDKTPFSITRDNDGNLWFTAQGFIGRMAPAGTIDYWPATASAYGADITLGPDGFMWFTGPQSNTIGKINRASGAITSYTLPPTLTPLSTFVGTGPQKIVAGPDGAMWFTHAGANRIGRITTTGQVTDFLVDTPQAGLRGITVGPDGNIWFTEAYVPKIGRITLSGVITEYEFAEPPATPAPFPSGGGAVDIVTWGDKVWFTFPNSAYRQNGQVGELTPSAPDPGASARLYELKHGEEDDDNTYPQNLAVGPDNNLWVTDYNGLSGVYWPEQHYLVRISPMAPTVKVDAFMLPLSSEYEGDPSTGIIGDVTADAPYVAFTESDPASIGRLDPRAATPRYSYRPGVSESVGENCVSSGDPAANEVKTNTKSCAIASAGPLSHVIISPWLNCQVWHVDDTDGEHYVDAGVMPPDRGGDGECGTFLVADGTWYGPKNVPCFYYYHEDRRPPEWEGDGCASTIYDHGADYDRHPDHYFELVEQTGVHGSGTTKDPYSIVTKVRAGSMILTQTDSYIVGRQTYRTDVTVTNAGGTASELLLTRAGDCWLNDSDHGGGRYTPATGAVACTSDAGETKGSMYTEPVEMIQSQMIEWTPISPGSNWAVGDRQGIWHLVGYKEPFPNSCVDGAVNAFDPSYYVDYVTGAGGGPARTEPGGATECGGENGAGLSWSFNLAPGESTTKSHYTTFSPYGNTVASVEDAEPVTEPATGQVNATFAVKLAHPSGRPVTLEYTAVDRSAKADDGDFAPTTGRVEFKPGELSKTISIPVKADGTAEDREDFGLVIRDPDDKIVDDPLVNDLGRPDVDPNSPDGAGFVNSQTVLISREEAIGIIDDGPYVAVDDAGVVDEPAAGQASADFRVRLGGNVTGPVTVNYATADGTATSGVDYQAVAGSLTFASGEREKTVTVPVHPDALQGESGETFSLELSDTSVFVARPRGEATIRDALLPVELSVGDVTANEPSAGSVPARFVIQLDRPSSAPVSVEYSTADGTAQADSDYLPVSGPLVIPPGETIASVTVSVLADSVNEPSETFRLHLSNPAGASLGNAEATATIVESQNGVSISDVSVTEGDTGTRPAVFTVSLSQPATGPVTVEYATADGSASQREDYSSKSDTVRFLPGEQSKTVVVDVRGDAKVEGTEQFAVVLSDPSGAPLGRSQGTGTIVDDDDEEPVVPERPPQQRSRPPVTGDRPLLPEVPPAVTQVAAVTPALVAALAPVPAPQPPPQPLSQTQVQQQAQQQNQQQAQRQMQQQAQQQAQAQAQAQLQAQAGMTTERQKETQVERAYVGERDSVTVLATAPAAGWVAALLGAGIALARRPRVPELARSRQGRRREARR